MAENVNGTLGKFCKWEKEGIYKTDYIYNTCIIIRKNIWENFYAFKTMSVSKVKRTVKQSCPCVPVYIDVLIGVQNIDTEN